MVQAAVPDMPAAAAAHVGGPGGVLTDGQVRTLIGEQLAALDLTGAACACPGRYSMANAPRPDGTLEFHIRAAGGGWVSGALVRRVKAGDMLRLAAPWAP